MSARPKWQIRGPYIGEVRKFSLIELTDDGSFVSRGMFKTRSEAAERKRNILAERRGEQSKARGEQ